MDGVRTGGGGRPGISLSGDLKPGSCGARLEGGVNLDQALAGNVGTCRSDAKGEAQADSLCESQSTDAGHRGGGARSRVDGSVMGSDRRGVVIQLYPGGNLKGDDRHG